MLRRKPAPEARGRGRGQEDMRSVGARLDAVLNIGRRRHIYFTPIQKFLCPEKVGGKES